MTIEKLLGKSAAELKAMSNKELEEYFAPFLKFTRPELIEKQPEKQSTKKFQSEEDYQKYQKKQKAMAMAREMGLDLKY